MANDFLDKPKAYKGNEKYIFVSYSHLDSENVYRDISILQSKGIRIWYDEGLPAGEEWDKIVYPKIISEQCACVIFFVSPHFFRSKSIAKEIEIVFNLKGSELSAKKNFSVHMGGVSILEMMQKAFVDFPNEVLHENISIITSSFNEKKTFVKRGNNLTHLYYDEIINNDFCNSALDNKIANKRSKKGRHYKILYLAKESSFSKAILDGLQEYYAGVHNINMSSILIDENNSLLADKLLSKILGSEESNFDGIILRPIFDVSNSLKDKLEQLIDLGKKVILIDKGLSDVQKKDFKVPVPLFVASDFAKGGEILGEKISELSALVPKEESQIILLDGPADISSAQERLSSLKQVLEKNNMETQTISIILKSFNVDEAVELLEERFGKWLIENDTTFRDKSLFIFLGNDNIALAIWNKFYLDKTSNIYRFFNSVKKVVYIGYDGILGYDGKIALSTIKADFLTINVIPSVQGRETARLMYEYLTKPEINKGVLIAPQLIKSNLIMKKTFKAKYINPSVYNQSKLLIFDLDGTIANTEKYHWESYNVLLSEYNILLDEKLINKYIGNNENTIWNMIQQDFDVKFNIPKMIKNRTQVVLSLFEEQNIQPFHYFKRVIGESKNIPKLILSSQIPEVIYFLLEKWDLKKIFNDNKIISVADGKITKKEVLENLSLYTSIAENYEPSDITIFEDSKETLSYAQKLGMKAIGIEHQYNKDKLSNCSYIINDNICNGLFIGLAGIDIIHYQEGSLPSENSKSKTNDYDIRVGGPAANAAITFANLGGNATLIAAIGNSVIGNSLKNLLESYGVIVIDLIKNSNESPNVSSIIINSNNGDRTIISGQKEVELHKNLKKPSLAPMDFCLYDCNAPKIFKLFSKEIEKMPVIVDAGSYKTHLDDCLHNFNEVISSVHFKKDNKSVLDLKKDYNWDFSAITNGEKRVEYSNANEVGHIEPPKISNVVDTLGAGDVLHGAYCFYRFYKKHSFVDSLKLAVEYASESVTHKRILKE